MLESFQPYGLDVELFNPFSPDADTEYLCHRSKNFIPIGCYRLLSMSIARFILRPPYRSQRSCLISPHRPLIFHETLPTETRYFSQLKADFLPCPKFQENRSTSRRKCLYPPVRRKFTTSPATFHGHITPPKPGEE